jgi:hypothetical protein
VSLHGLFNVWLSALDALVFIAILSASISMECTEALRGVTLGAMLHNGLVPGNAEIFYIFISISSTYTRLQVKIESVLERGSYTFY